MTGSPFHVRREHAHLAWDRSVEPVLRVGSGDEVDFDALDASNGQITAMSTHDDLVALDFSRVDQAHGPVHVDGAEPGDTLEIGTIAVVFNEGDPDKPSNPAPFGTFSHLCASTASESARSMPTTSFAAGSQSR